MPRVLPEDRKGFLVAAVTGTGEAMVLDGRALDDPIQIGNRFVRMLLMDVDEASGDVSLSLLSEVEVEVVGIETYGRARKFLGVGMTGRLAVRSTAEQAPFEDTVLEGPNEAS